MNKDIDTQATEPLQEKLPFWIVPKLRARSTPEGWILEILPDQSQPVMMRFECKNKQELVERILEQLPEPHEASPEEYAQANRE